MRLRDILVLIKGGGEMASGVAHRLFKCWFKIAILEQEKPTVVRRAVAFASAIYD